jgi:hypothetical protein
MPHGCRSRDATAHSASASIGTSRIAGGRLDATTKWAVRRKFGPRTAAAPAAAAARSTERHYGFPNSALMITAEVSVLPALIFPCSSNASQPEFAM